MFSGAAHAIATLATATFFLIYPVITSAHPCLDGTQQVDQPEVRAVKVRQIGRHGFEVPRHMLVLGAGARWLDMDELREYFVLFNQPELLNELLG